MRRSKPHHENRLKISPLVAALALAGLTTPAFALDHAWNVPTSGAWEADANWLPNGAPGSADTAIFSNGTAILTTNTLINRLQTSGGALTGAGTLTVSSSHAFAGFSMLGTGRTVLQGTGTISNTLNLDDDRVIENQGTTVWSGGTIYFNRLDADGGAGTIQNNAGALFDTTVNGTMGNYLAGTAGLFDNQGTFRKSGGTGTTTIGNTLNNSGTVEALSGNILLNGGGSHSGDFIGNGGTVTIGRGAHQLLASSNLTGDIVFTGYNWDTDVNTVDGTINTNALTIGQYADVVLNTNATTSDLTGNNGGRLRGPGNLTATASHNFNNTTQAGTGRTILQGTGTISNTLNLDDGRVIENQGTTVWSGGIIEFNRHDSTGGAGTIQNNAGALFDTTVNGTMRNYLAGTAGLFDNQGTFRKSGGTGTTTVSNTLNNSGTVDVQTGRIRVQSAFVNTGDIQIANGAAFAGNDSTFINNGTIAGNGTLETHSNGDIENNGKLAPGIGGIGTLTVDADLRLQASSLLEFELASLGSFDQMLLTGDILIDGALSIKSLGGYVPQFGDTFVISTFDSSIGNQTFDSVSWSGFGGGTHFDVLYNADNITLAVAAVPEPSAYLMMLAGLGMLGAVVRRRR